MARGNVYPAFSEPEPILESDTFKNCIQEQQYAKTFKCLGQYHFAKNFPRRVSHEGFAPTLQWNEIRKH